MSVNTSSIFIWRGNIHLGDEPGIYGNAAFSGLSVKYPLTIKNITTAQPDVLYLSLTTEDVNVFGGYPGHKVVIRGYSPVSPGSNTWKETVLKDTDRITQSNTPTLIAIPIPANADPTYISVSIEIETDIMPGLYDDFLLTELGYGSEKDSIYVEFGFR